MWTGRLALKQDYENIIEEKKSLPLKVDANADVYEAFEDSISQEHLLTLVTPAVLESSRGWLLLLPQQEQ